MTGQRLLDRYEILGEAPRAAGGPLLRARDLAFGEIVAVKYLTSGKMAERSFRAAESEWRRLQKVAHPAFVQYRELHREEGIFIREWVHGFSMLELLKRQHQLAASDALHRFAVLPETLDFLTAHDLAVPRPLLAKLLVEFAADVDVEAVLLLPLKEWPACALKLNPLSVRASLLDSEEQTMTTVADLDTLLPESAASVPFRLAELLYEMFGGRTQAGRKRRYAPLPALREDGNLVLRQALLESAFPSCASLWKALEKAEPFEGKAAPLVKAAAVSKPLRLSRRHEAEPQPARILKLHPLDPATPSVLLIALPAFKIGRSIHHADFITRFLPGTDANEDLTNQLSRVHVLAERRGGGLTLRDGNGDAPSVNGTTLDDALLPADPPTPFHRRCALCLGGVYTLEAIPLLSPAPLPLPVGASAREAEAGQPGGAVVFLPLRAQPPIRQAVWLFSEIGFALDLAGCVVWETQSGGKNRAAFHHHAGAFWLSNRRLGEDALQLDGVSLLADEFAPLRAGMRVRLASHEFTIELT